MSESQSPAPGWYVDPGVTDRLRYWDGERWTGDYLPNVPPGSRQSPYPPAAAPGHQPGPQPGHQPGPHGGTNGMAIASMVLGILWIFGLGSILALIFGYVGLSQIKRKHETGRGMAIAGVVLGWVGVGFLVLFIVLASLPTPTIQTCPGRNCGFVQGAPAFR